MTVECWAYVWADGEVDAWTNWQTEEQVWLNKWRTSDMREEARQRGDRVVRVRIEEVEG